MLKISSKKTGLIFVSTLILLSGCDTNPIRDVHPLTNLPFASNYPIGEDGSSRSIPARSKTYCSTCGLKVPRPAHKTAIIRGPDGEPL